jgi:hypothetical protein
VLCQIKSAFDAARITFCNRFQAKVDKTSGHGTGGAAIEYRVRKMARFVQAGQVGGYNLGGPLCGWTMRFRLANEADGRGASRVLGELLRPVAEDLGPRIRIDVGRSGPVPASGIGTTYVKSADSGTTQ